MRVKLLANVLPRDAKFRFTPDMANTVNSWRISPSLRFQPFRIGTLSQTSTSLSACAVTLSGWCQGGARTRIGRWVCPLHPSRERATLAALAAGAQPDYLDSELGYRVGYQTLAGNLWSTHGLITSDQLAESTETSWRT